MAEESKFPTEIEFFFEYDKDYRTIASNGAWGGLTTRGDIHIDFFVEKQGNPESMKQVVSKDGTLGAVTETRPGKRVVRRLQVGVLMTFEEAKNLIKFLNDKVDQYEKLKAKANVH